MERYYGKLKHFSYAITEELKDEALNLIPDFCGLYIVTNKGKVLEQRKPKTLFNYKWNEKERYNLARLAAMRIYKLKCKIAALQTIQK